MKCPNLVEVVKQLIFLCKAGSDFYVQNRFELNEYCTGGKYRRCPLYLAVSKPVYVNPVRRPSPF